MNILPCVLGRLPEPVEGGELGECRNSHRDKPGVEEKREGKGGIRLGRGEV